MPPSPLTLHLANEGETQLLGKKLAGLIKPGFKIYLIGELGSGKTTLARALIHALGFTGKVKSPTFTLVEVYAISSITLYHFDFYRFDNPREWLESGFQDYFHSDALCLVEWPDKATALPAADLLLKLNVTQGGRDVIIESHTQKGKECLVSLLKLISKNNALL